MGNVHVHFNVSFSKLPKRLSKPYLHLECRDDPIVLPVMVKMQAENCDNLTITSFSAGHWLLLQDPEGSVKAILDWLPGAVAS